jgi:hypothetical protein
VRAGSGAVAPASTIVVFDSQDPNLGVLTPTGAVAPVYRPDVGRTARVGARWSWSVK